MSPSLLGNTERSGVSGVDCSVSSTVDSSASFRACECFEVPLLLTGVLLVESALWNFHRVEYLFRQGTLR